jgi:hypothetical protein
MLAPARGHRRHVALSLKPRKKSPGSERGMKAGQRTAATLVGVAGGKQTVKRPLRYSPVRLSSIQEKFDLMTMLLSNKWTPHHADFRRFSIQIFGAASLVALGRLGGAVA